MASDLHGSLQDTVDSGSDKFIVWENLSGEPKNASYIYGCKNTKIHQPEISGCYGGFRCDGGKYYAEKQDFIKGYRDEITYEFTYDVDNKEFAQHF